MRNRRKTAEALRRLAERPGTPAEGDTARRLLAKMEATLPSPKPFVIGDWPRGTRVFYNYWCYDNEPGTIVGTAPKTEAGQTWLRIQFDHLKQARAVPVTSEKGCHLSRKPLDPEQAVYLHGMDWEFAAKTHA